MKLRPLRDSVLVRRDTAELKTPGGLFVPEAHAKPIYRGEVLAVGPGVPNARDAFMAETLAVLRSIEASVGRLAMNTPALALEYTAEPAVKVGDVVLFTQYSGTAVGAGVRTVGGGDDGLLLLREEDILAVVEKE